MRTVRWTLSALWMCAAVSMLPGCASCESGARRHKNDGPDPDGGEERDASLDECASRAFRCDGTIATACSDGGTAAPVDCASQGKVCSSDVGCADCVPGATSCDDGKATWCRDDGTLARFDCDATQGLTCSPGGCQGPCALNEVRDSYIGCDYYPTVTLNSVWSGFPFAIAVSNADEADVHVTVTQGEQTIRELTIARNSLETIALPWVSELKGGDVACQDPPPASDTRVVRASAYRVRSDRPVTVYQFSPLAYQLGGDTPPASCPVLSECSESPISKCFSFTNDASLLVPANALTGNYTVLSWPTQDEGSGFVAITATEDDTRVRLLGASKVRAGGGVASDGTGEVTLERGDVLQVVAGTGGDLSGSRIRASKPVQVIAGQSCANVPSATTGFCDHLEEGLFPEDALGKEYIVTLPTYPETGTSNVFEVPAVLRLAAIEADTEVTFDPPVREKLTLQGGEVFTLELTGAQQKSLHLSATKPLLVATYMVGQQALPNDTSNIGDPSMSLSVPVEQFRTSYLFTAHETYLLNIATVIAPKDARVTIDGSALSAETFAPVGDSEYGVAHVILDGSTSVHTLESDREVGLTVYGYGAYTSYMYPGGADLEHISIPPIL